MRFAVVAAFGFTTAVVEANAYFQIFSFFAEYDDEGHLLILLKLFRPGFALHDTVFPAWTLLGALAAALALTKINVGVFALLAIGLVALGTFATTPARRRCRDSS